MTRVLGRVKWKVKDCWKTLHMANPKFQIPWGELCEKCREILRARKKEFERFRHRVYMHDKRLRDKKKRT